MRVATTRAELAAALDTDVPGPDAAGTPDAPGPAARRRAVVMTMGALHEGHLSLVRAARELADEVVVTIFVNPLQFGPSEDLARYPRDLDGDLAKLASVGADVVFAPPTDEVYPRPAVVTVRAGRVGEVLEGEHRPGHMDGVLTVVLKLLHLTRPQLAVFGRKDAQQLVAIRRMVADLDAGVEVVGAPTVREPDGLAMSSRNAYLAPGDRARALVLWRALTAGAQAAGAGGSPEQVHAAAAQVLAAEPTVAVDYLALTDPDLEPVPQGYRGPALLLVAARVGGTRLIDNVALTLGPGGERTADPV